MGGRPWWGLWAPLDESPAGPAGWGTGTGGLGWEHVEGMTDAGWLPPSQSLGEATGAVHQSPREPRLLGLV